MNAILVVLTALTTWTLHTQVSKLARLAEVCSKIADYNFTAYGPGMAQPESLGVRVFVRIDDEQSRGFAAVMAATLQPNPTRSANRPMVAKDIVVFIHSQALREVSEETWTFVLCHELSHAYLLHRGDRYENEQEADTFGLGMAKNYFARESVAANGGQVDWDAMGKKAATYIEEACALLPEQCSASHGCPWHRLNLLAKKHSLSVTCLRGREQAHRHGSSIKPNYGLPSWGRGEQVGWSYTCGPTVSTGKPCEHSDGCVLEDWARGGREIESPVCLRKGR